MNRICTWITITAITLFAITPGIAAGATPPSPEDPVTGEGTVLEVQRSEIYLISVDDQALFERFLVASRTANDILAMRSHESERAFKARVYGVRPQQGRQVDAASRLASAELMRERLVGQRVRFSCAVGDPQMGFFCTVEQSGQDLAALLIEERLGEFYPLPIVHPRHCRYFLLMARQLLQEGRDQKLWNHEWLRSSLTAAVEHIAVGMDIDKAFQSAGVEAACQKSLADADANLPRWREAL